MPESPVVRYDHRSLDVACELDAAGMETRGDEWRTLREAWVEDVELRADGVRLWLAAGAWDAADDLARREAACCGFLDFELGGSGDRMWLDITSPAAEAEDVIAALAGLPDR